MTNVLVKKILLLTFMLIMMGIADAQDLQWINGYTSSIGTNNTTKIDASGNIYISGGFTGTVDFDPGPGTTNLTSAGSFDIFISKLDASGNLIWAHRIGGASNDGVGTMELDVSGNVYVTGWFQESNIDFNPGAGTNSLSSSGLTDVYVLKLNSSGVFQWVYQGGGTGSDEGHGLAVDGSGNVYLAGDTRGGDFDNTAGTTTLGGNGLADVFVVQLNSSGTFQWGIDVGGTGRDEVMALELENSGDIFVGGIFSNTVDFDPSGSVANQTSNGLLDAFLLQLNSSGGYQDVITWGGSSNDGLNDFEFTSTGSVVATSYFDGTIDVDPYAGTKNITAGSSNTDQLVQLFDIQNDKVLWYKQIDITSTGLFGLDIDADNRIYHAGFYSLFGIVEIYDVDGNDEFSISPTFGMKAYGAEVEGTNFYVYGGFTGNTNFDLCGGTHNVNGLSGDKAFIAKYAVESLADEPVLTATATSIFPTESTTISIQSGNLNSAIDWQWYTGSCGGTPIGSGTSISVSPTTSTTYFVRGEGYSCIAEGGCSLITITVEDPYLNYGVCFDLSNGANGRTAEFDISAQSIAPQDLAYNDDGTKLFVLQNNVFQYNLTTPYDISSGISYSGTSYAAGGEGMAFSSDGLKLFIVVDGANEVRQYSLPNPFDISDVVSLDGSFSVASEETNPSDIRFSSDGSKMFIVGYNSDQVRQYNLTTPFAITSGVSLEGSYDPTATAFNPSRIDFSADGSIMFVDMHQFSLATPFDITSGVTADGYFLNTGPNSTGSRFHPDGKTISVADWTNDVVAQYEIITGGFNEVEENDGSVDGSLITTITGDTFTNAGSTLAETTDYTIDNLPAGFTPTMTVAADGLSATLTLSGNADLHQDINDLSSLVFTFENSAFTNSDASSVVDAISASSEIGINFTQNVPVIAYDYAYNPANYAGAGNFGLLAQEGSTQGITFNADGTKVYIVGTGNDQVFQYSLSTPFDVTTASLDGNSISLDSQDGNPLGLAFNDNGTSLFVAGGISESILEYSLSTPFDVTTGFSYSNNSLDVSSQGYPNGLAFSNDGMKLFTTSSSTDQVSQFSLTTAFDISSGVTFDGAYSVLDQENTPNGIAFSESGTTMIIMGSSTQASQKYVHNYHLETPFDITSGVTPYNNPVNVNAYEFGPTDIAFSNDGARMFIVGYNGDEINQFNMQVGSLTESASNDGSISGSYVLQIYDELFTNAGGTLTQGVDYNISNLPAGLTTFIAVSVDGKTGTLTVSGTASSHDVVDNVESLIFTFENSAFSIGDASFVTHAVNASSELSIHFIEAPSINNQTFSIAENSINTTVVGTVVGSDGDGDPITYSITAGNDLGGFAIDANSGEITVADESVMDFETNPSFDLTVQVTDGSLANAATITIDLTNVAEAPTDLALSQNNIDENNEVNDVIGQFSSTDEDASETYTYSLISGSGDTDNASFNINGDELRASEAFNFEAQDTYSIRVQTDDGNGGTFAKTFTINIENVFEVPTGIGLFGNSIAENNSVNDEIGTLSTTDEDAGEAYTYTLVSGTGDTDNASFNISTNKLRASESFNFESKSSYNIRIQTDDGNGGTFEEQFTIAVNDVSEAPTDISLSVSEILENNNINDIIGTLSSLDEDSGETFTYSLVSGAGDTDNSSFNIDNDQLRASEVFDFETKNSYSIRLQTNDGNFGLFEKVFTITIDNQQEDPTDILLSSSDIDESSPVGTTVGNLSTVDEDTGETYTYSFVSGAGDTDNASFNISGNELRSGEIFDFETKTSYSIRIQTNDGNGGVLEKAFTISVNDQPPGLTGVGITSSSIDENVGIGTGVGNLFALGDEIEGVSFTFTLVAGAGDTGNGAFTVVGAQLRSSSSFDHESQDQHSIRVMADDGAGSTIEQILLIDVNDVNEEPSLVDVNENEYDEGLVSGTVLTDFFVSDEDAGDSHSFSFVSGIGDTDNDKFEVQGQNLATLETFDFESQSEYSIRVRATDGVGLSVESSISIFVNDINDDPSDIILSSTQVDENSSIGTEVSTLTSADQDSGDSHAYSLVSGSGDTDNSQFTISGNSLQINFIPDFETKSSYSIRLQTDDGNGGIFQEALIIAIEDLNEDPTDISLSNSTIEESTPIGSYVGSLSSIDEDASQTHSYSFVSGAGDADNGSFTISGNDILSGEVFDFETKNTYTVRILSEDGNGGSFEKVFTVSITDLPASITSFTLSNDDIDENLSSGAVVGSFSTSGEDLSGSFTYSLVSGSGDADNSSFSVSGDQLITAESFDFESKSSYTIRVMTDDGSQSEEQAFNILINDISEAPTGLLLSASTIDENNTIDDVIGSFSTIDEDSGETYTYALSSGLGDDDNMSFTIEGSELKAAEVFDFETKSLYTIRVETNDGNGGTFQETFTISVNDLGENSAPIATHVLSDVSFDNGFVLGTRDLALTFEDPDNDPITLSAISSDEGIATVDFSGTTLRMHEVGTGTTTITVTADDGNGGITTADFELTINFVAQEAPTAIALSNNTVDENSPVSTLVGQLSASDVNVYDEIVYSLVSGTGDDNNASFSISGLSLRTNAILDFDATPSLSIRIQADDQNGGTFEQIFSILVNDLGDNEAPIVNTSLADLSEEEGFGSIQIDLSNTFSDPDGDALTLSVVSSNESVATASISGNTLNLNEIGIGTSIITVTADDGNGATVSDEFTLTINESPNSSPIVANPIDDAILEEGFASLEIDLTNTFSDADGDALTLSVVSSNESVATSSISGNTLNLNEIGIGTSTITVTAEDESGGTVSDEFTLTINESPNSSPIVANPIDDVALEEGFSSLEIDLTNTFSDADGDALTLSVVSSDESVATSSISGNTLNLNEIGIGTSIITVTADDGNGATVSDEFTLTINESPNSSPIVANPVDDVTLEEGFGSQEIDLTNTFSDADGDALTLSVVSSDESVGTVSLSGTTLVLTEIGVGTSTITVTANDGNGASISDEFTITINPVLSVNDKIDVEIYPNPVIHYLNVNAKSDVEIILFDLEGRQIKSAVGKRVSMDLRGLSRGVYLLKIKDEKSVTAKRIIKAN